MKRFFLRVTGRLPEQEENEEERKKDNFGKEERRQVNQVELETAGGARRRWRLAKNMVLVAFKVVFLVLFMTIVILFALIMTTIIVALMALIMTVMFVLQVEKDEEQSGSSRRHPRGERRRLSFLGQQYANMVR